MQQTTLFFGLRSVSVTKTASRDTVIYIYTIYLLKKQKKYYLKSAQKCFWNALRTVDEINLWTQNTALYKVAPI